ncbi:MAG: zinc dependent phospholipase C family protein [Ruminococcus sp.]|nr:zinc dependent phospholipase C family protein [Ruminococcus sp.]
MPDIVVHTNFGSKIARKLELEIDRDIYNFGLLGPDPYLFYHFYMKPFGNRVNKYSSVMHREHTGEFLTELAKRAKDDEDVFAYLAGFLCHYALDSDTHPYINRKAKNSAAMHMAIEHKLDKLNGGKISIPPFLPERMKEPVGGAITGVYGWKDAWDKLRAGHRDMAPFYKIVEDKKGRLNFFASLTHTKLELISYRSKALDNMDLRGFAPLYQRAQNDAVKYIEAAQAFVKGEIDEEAFREVIGDRSYIDG